MFSSSFLIIFSFSLSPSSSYVFILLFPNYFFFLQLSYFFLYSSSLTFLLSSIFIVFPFFSFSLSPIFLSFSFLSLAILLIFHSFFSRLVFQSHLFIFFPCSSFVISFLTSHYSSILIHLNSYSYHFTLHLHHYSSLPPLILLFYPFSSLSLYSFSFSRSSCHPLYPLVLVILLALHTHIKRRAIFSRLKLGSGHKGYWPHPHLYIFSLGWMG